MLTRQRMQLGNEVIPHQSHATAGEEVEAAEEAMEECPHCNGDHTLAECPDLTLEQLEEIYAQLGVEEEIGGRISPAL